MFSRFDYKSVVGASLFTFFGAVSTYLFKDRETSIHEMNEYERYVTEFLVLNEHPAKKRMLAQYFASVTPSNFQQKNWKCYLDAVEKDYQNFLNEDSTKKARFKVLLDKDELTKSEIWEKGILENELAESKRKEAVPIITPNQNQIGDISRVTIYIQHTETSLKKAKQIKEELTNLGFNVPEMEKKEQIIDDDIRYYNKENKEIIDKIIQNIKDSQKLTLKPKDFSRLNSKVQSNIFEIWLK